MNDWQLRAYGRPAMTAEEVPTVMVTRDYGDGSRVTLTVNAGEP